MADNFTLNNTNVAGGPTYRDLDRAGVRTQVVQLDLGGAAAEVLAAGSVPVSGAVSVANFPATQAVSGPVTDAQLRATALPISGTVNTGGLTDTQLRATAVAMSAASLPLPTGASTEATLAGVRTDLGTDGATPPPVLGAGTGVRGWLRSIYEKLTGSIAVTGTFFQATQPVSMAANTPDVTDRAGRALGTIANTTFGATLAAETTKVIGTVNLAAAQTLAALTAITNALPAGSNSIGTTPGPALTKGTQGTVGHSTQDLKDAGRVMVTYSATALAGVTTETLINLTPLRDLVAGTAATSHAVTAGKRLRLQSISLTLRSTSTVNVGAIVRFRLLAGTVLVGSPVHNSLACMSSNLATAVIGNARSEQVQFPEGLELSGTMQLGLTQLASATSATLDIHVTGYEY